MFKIIFLISLLIALIFPQSIGAAMEVVNVPTSTGEAEFDVNVSLSGLSAGATYYLKGVFYKPGLAGETPDYFGYTKVNSTLVKSKESYSKQFLITTDPNGAWQGVISFRPD